MAQISLTVDVAVPNGPKLWFRRALDVEAIDKIDLIITSKTKDQEIELQPGGAGQVQLVMIVAEPYDANLSYKVNKKAGDARALDQPHLFAGAGAVSMLDSGAPTKLFLSNDTADDAKVQILIGRDATP
ncbi:MAG TPA: hypothetical protein VKD70_05215 [Candidatus Acidoferrum sp.]|nr:hypothetical protein [Candidatus Acidoferrum sp.]